MDTPNAVWTTDYKGQFKLGDGAYCFPLTVADGYSRMLLACQALTNTRFEPAPSSSGCSAPTACPGASAPITASPSPPGARPALLPRGLVDPARHPPRSHRAGLPHQNGRHERMHLTLKRECTRPPRYTRRQQQHCFDRWRQEYNTLRPHEALDEATPASVYTPSPRPYPARLSPLEYPGHYEVRRVSRNGGIRWHKQWVNVSQTLGEEYLGFVEINDGEWDVYFGPLRLADSMSAPSSSRMPSASSTAGVTDCHLCLRT